MIKKILIIDDRANTLKVLEAILNDEGYNVIKANNGMEALSLLEEIGDIDAVLSDLKMPGMDGLELFRRMKKAQLDLPFIIMTAHGTVESAVKAMKEGITNYLIKPLNFEELAIVLERAIREKRISSELANLRKEVREKESAKKIIGKHPKMDEVFERIRAVAPIDAPVLIYGETGTGKEMIAKSIHSLSTRYDQPMICINSAALSETLLEDELFGHVKGAFTGAASYKKGRLESAHGGSLFLDEIGFMSLGFQTKLLRFLQDGTFDPVGGVEMKHVNVRTIAATNKNLDEEITAGRFLKDLLYRIEVISINLPPLRERGDDIFLLVDHFIRKFSSEYQKSVVGIDDEAMGLLQKYKWPGNIRELENCMARAVILAKHDKINAVDLSGKIRIASQNLRIKKNGGYINDLPEGGIKLKALERELIQKTLKKCDGNKSLTSDFLGISRKTLYEKIERFDIKA